LRVKRNIFARGAGQLFADLPVVPMGRTRERHSALALQANQPAAEPGDRSWDEIERNEIYRLAPLIFC
jgi:hypothetical protein